MPSFIGILKDVVPFFMFEGGNLPPPPLETEMELLEENEVQFCFFLKKKQKEKRETELIAVQ